MLKQQSSCLSVEGNPTSNTIQRKLTDQSLTNGSSNNVQVVIRVRPHTESYQQLQQNCTLGNISLNGNNSQIGLGAIRATAARKCILDIKDKKSIILPSMNNIQDVFNYDFVGGEDVSQEEIFQAVGKPIVDQCLQGYNGSMFAYGQTGSGKTYTIQGRDTDKQQRGLLPRCFEYLFQQICKIKSIHQSSLVKGGKRSRQSGMNNLPKLHDNATSVEFDVKCQYLEIYNEVIMDLLDSSQARVQLRETPEKGVYPEPCTEETVNSIQEVMEVISRGSRNRHVGSTNMNSESSRSHAIFTAIIKMTQCFETGESFIKTSRFHIVDLAGSERAKDTGAEGQRLKEASMINKSLTVLGQVIYDLADTSQDGIGTKASVKNKYIRYRESKLTYLLKDALGGNSKTVMICNVNPHIDALKETRTTLQFAQRAKMIKNVAVVNEENTSEKYWKDRYHKEIALVRANSQPVSNHHSLCIKCDKHNEGIDQLQFDSVHVKEVHQYAKQVALALKEEQEKWQDQEMQYRQHIKELEAQLKNKDYIFKLKQTHFQQVQEQLNKLNTRRSSDQQFAKQYNAGEENNQELVNELSVLLQVYKDENEELKRQIQQNPQVVMQYRQIQDLERRLQEVQGHKEPCQISQLIQTMISKTDLIIQQVNELQNIIDLQQKNQMMDVDEVNNMSTRPRESLLAIRSINDFSMISQQRGMEIANLKLTYEDQIQDLKDSLRKKDEYLRKVRNFMTQASQRLPQQQELSQNDLDLLTCSQVDQYMNIAMGCLNHTQTGVNNQMSQVSFGNGGQQRTQGSRSNSSKGPGLSAESSVILELQQNSYPRQSTPPEDLKQLYLQLQQENQSLQQRIAYLEEEALQSVQDLTQLTSKLNTLHQDKQSQEQLALKLNDDLDRLSSELETQRLENQSLISKIQELDDLIRDYADIKVEILQLQDENKALSETNDYFSNDLIPSMKEQIGRFEKEMNQIIGERDKARDECTGLKLQVQNQTQDYSSKQLIGDLQTEVEFLKAEKAQRDQELRHQVTKITEFYEQISQMSKGIGEQNETIKDLQDEVKKRKDQIYELQGQVEEYQGQKQESELIMQGLVTNNEALEKSVNALKDQIKILTELKEGLEHNLSQSQRELQQFKNMKTDHEERLRILRCDKLALEDQLNNQLQQSLSREKALKDQLIQSNTSADHLILLMQKTAEKQKMALEAMQSMKRSSNQDREQVEKQNAKLKEELFTLRDIASDRQLQMQSLNQKIAHLEQTSSLLSDCQSRLRNMEREYESMKKEHAFFEMQARHFEAEAGSQHKRGEELFKKYNELEGKYLQLIQGNEPSTTRIQHLTKLRGERNDQTKELIQLKKDLDREHQKKVDTHGMLSQFGDFVIINVMKLQNRVQVMKGCGGGLKQDLANLKEFLATLQDVIQQGCTNVRLHLETPNFFSQSIMHNQLPLHPNNSHSTLNNFTTFTNDGQQLQNPDLNNQSIVTQRGALQKQLINNHNMLQAEDGSSEEESGSSSSSTEQKFNIFQETGMDKWGKVVNKYKENGTTQPAFTLGEPSKLDNKQKKGWTKPQMGYKATIGISNAKLSQVKGGKSGFHSNQYAPLQQVQNQISGNSNNGLPQQSHI